MGIWEREAKKYSEAWSIPAYAKFSPGEGHADLFLEIAKPEPGSSVIDIGAGSGAASRKLKDKGLAVTAFDLVNSAWAHPDIHLVTGTLWRPLPLAGFYRYGFCCDVMEHIPTEYTALAIHNILDKCANVFFSISFEQDHFGAYLERDLHLTVKPFVWWRDMLRELGTVREARDFLGEGVFYVSGRTN